MIHFLLYDMLIYTDSLCIFDTKTYDDSLTIHETFINKLTTWIHYLIMIQVSMT